MYSKIAGQELAEKELDVSTLQSILEESQTKVSQNLSLLKSYKSVVERKEGRRVFYSLSLKKVAPWLLSGLELIEAKSTEDKQLRKALINAKKKWGEHA